MRHEQYFSLLPSGCSWSLRKQKWIFLFTEALCSSWVNFLSDRKSIWIYAFLKIEHSECSFSTEWYVSIKLNRSKVNADHEINLILFILNMHIYLLSVYLSCILNLLIWWYKKNLIACLKHILMAKYVECFLLLIQ